MSMQFRIIDQGEAAPLRYALAEVYSFEDGLPVHSGELLFEANDLSSLMACVIHLLSAFIKPSVDGSTLTTFAEDL